MQFKILTVTIKDGMLIAYPKSASGV